jgi:hypothetical protein
LNAQIDDKIIRLDSDSNSSFNSDFNQKYQIFPQFTNLYQGFLVKPEERQGYYAWLQLKQDGYLKDTIIWIDKSSVQSILNKIPDGKRLLTDSTKIDYVLTGRAKMLSFMNKRKEIEIDTIISKSKILTDSITIFNDDFAWDYSKFNRLIKDEDWEIVTDTASFKDVALKGRIRNNLVISKDLNQDVIDINKISSIKQKGTNLWFLGTILGIPAGVVVGGLVGLLLVGDDHRDFAALAGLAIGGTIGGLSGGILGGIWFGSFETGTDIRLTSSDPYDRYFELDRKTFFTLPELESDGTIKVNKISDTLSHKLAKSEEQSLVTNEIRRQSELDKPQFSLGGGFFYPLNFNLNLLFYFNDYLGFSYTGFPVPFKENDNEDCSRYGMFYRIHAKKNFFDNVGIHYSQRSQFTYDYRTYEKIKFKFNEIGIDYDVSFYGVFLQVGFNYVTSNLYNYTINSVSFNLQFGYRYTF